MKNSDLALIGVAVIGIIYASKARAASTLIILPGGIDGIEFQGTNPVIGLSLLVQNTSSTGFVLESLAGNLFCDNTLIGNVSSFSPVHIAANQQTLVPVQARLMPVGIVNQLITAITQKVYQKKLQLKGFVNAGFLRAPLNVEFNVGA